MNKDELQNILMLHVKWLNDEPGGVRANLYGADLSGANLYGADLSGADLSGADLSGANLSRANLSRANLSGANLSRANLSGANLSGANLYGANLSGANLYGADLSGADLSGADLSGAKEIFLPMVCPEKGKYTAFKKANGKIVELEIPEDALRSSASSRKCRASKAVVISITNMDGTTAGDNVQSDFDKKFTYRVGETVAVDNFDKNRWNECAPGIHHYISREEAVRHI